MHDVFLDHNPYRKTYLVLIFLRPWADKYTCAKEKLERYTLGA